MGRLSLKGNTVNFSNFHKETDKMNRALLILVIVAVAAQVTIAAPQKERLFFNWFKPTTQATTTTESGVTGASGGGIAALEVLLVPVISPSPLASSAPFYRVRTMKIA